MCLGSSSLIYNMRTTSIVWMFVGIYVTLHDSRVSAATCNDTTVLIVGAGASAIGAANKFYERDMKDFLILEAKNYVGGRIYNQIFAGASLPLGASWVHKVGENNSIWKLVLKHDLKFHIDDFTRLVFMNGSTGEEIDAGAPTHKLLESLQSVESMMKLRLGRKQGDLSVSVALCMNGWKANSELEEAVELISFQVSNGISSFKTSASGVAMTGEKPNYIIKDDRGYGFVLQEESKKFSSKILLQKIVTKVTWNKVSSNYQIDVADGSCYTAKSVLVTVSSNVLAANAIEFSPLLPDWKVQALSMFPLGHFCKYFLEFDRQFWSAEFYTMLVRRSVTEYSIVQNFKRPTLFPDKNILMITTIDEFCKKDQLRPDKEVMADIVKVLREGFGANVTEPLGLMRNFWSIDPFVRGAYSNPAPGVSEQDFIAVRHPVGNIWFAGEHTGGLENYGYAQGAYDSGTQRAEAILACMSDASKCPGDFVRAPVCESSSSTRVVVSSVTSLVAFLLAYFLATA